MPTFRPLALMTLLTVAGACAPALPPTPAQAALTGGDPQSAFWGELLRLCGQAYEGRVLLSEPPDAAFDTARLVMHVRECTPSAIHIPFHVDADRSRTWVLTRTAEGLRLKHDHRHEDGTEDDVTQYGGDTTTPGSAFRQEFPADAFTKQLIPYAATNVWTFEIEPGRRFVYDLRREGTERRFRAEFDLTRQVPAPPPPWGW
jgi:hypothetical protein